jgi:hypothetical protein
MAGSDEEDRLFAGFSVRTLERELSTAVEAEQNYFAVRACEPCRAS